ncbi:MerR family transcriptional regulator [Oceanobacillus profundus]|uniref:MerR family transcriptional regulator n=1 Tax=Oceanobacillus profundus TaxID=372463 RepID=A0A417YNZ3_9BACI|nr:MerR family transcriptional regulator [Oceanobacillus profundus]RHW35340.1 MerR family transcriptional regulator [Oceanobacillus profundus]
MKKKGESFMQIKEVAKQLNTTPRAIRFYEEKGLIAPKKDAENEYRYFSDTDVSRLSTILALREIGLPVKGIKKVLEDPDMTIKGYLHVQRSALVEQWLEIKDMIDTIDRMVECTDRDFYDLAQHLKKLKHLRKGWEDKWGFDSWAEDFDNHIKQEGHGFNVHQGYDEALERIAGTVHLDEHAVCADIGVGTGNLGAKFLAKGINVIGIDQSKKMLEICNKKHPEIEVRHGHFLALPLLDSQVDTVVSSYALHHLLDSEKLLALSEMTRVLKPNGQICIADLMFLDETHQAEVMDALRMEGNTEAIEAIEDEYYADRSLLVKWLEENQYKVETVMFNDILSMIYAKKVDKAGS